MYNINDCMLVRITDIFPRDGVIRTRTHDKAYSFGSSYYLENFLRARFRSMGIEYPTECDVLYENKRSTVHFTINGLVTDSFYGRFNRPFIILEPLKHHISEKTLLSLKVEDTYFNDDVVLSDDCVIMIEESYLEQVKKEVDLSKFNIRVFSGNKNEALKENLEELGYPYFRVCDHGYSDALIANSLASQMFFFIRDFARANGIEQTKHFTSDIHYADVSAIAASSKEYSKKHLLYILDNGLVDEELANEIRKLLNMGEEREMKPYLERLVYSIDLDKLKELTIEFNNIELAKLKGDQTKIVLKGE